MRHYLIAYDIGTSGTKTTLFSESGEMLKSRTHSYPVHYSNTTWAEEDPYDWWNAVRQTTGYVLEGISPFDVAAISLTGHMSGALLLDKHLEVIRPHIMWSDTRACKEAEKVRSMTDFAEHFRQAGKAPGSSRMLEKLLWLQKNEPGSFKRIGKVLQAKDFIAFMLTGQIYTDYSDASATYLFDREKKVFSKDLLALGHLNPSIMPQAVPSTQVIGTVTKEAAACLYVNQCTLAAAGISYKWMKSILFDHIDPAALKESPYELMNQMADRAPAGANNTMFLPYLLGDQSLYNDDNASGAFLGLRADTDSSDMIRAVLEGVCCYLSAAADILTNHSLYLPTPPVLIGGATKGVVWSRILSDVLGQPCMVSCYPEEATSIGAAIIGGIGVGIFPDFTVAEHIVKVHEATLPNMENHIKYAAQQKTFLEAYYKLEPLFTMLRG